MSLEYDQGAASGRLADLAIATISALVRKRKICCDLGGYCWEGHAVADAEHAITMTEYILVTTETCVWGIALRYRAPLHVSHKLVGCFRSGNPCMMLSSLKIVLLLSATLLDI